MATAKENWILNNGPREAASVDGPKKERSSLSVKASKPSLQVQRDEPEIKVNIYYTDADEEVHRIGDWVGVAWHIGPSYSDEEDEDSGDTYIVDWGRNGNAFNQPWITFDEVSGEPYGPDMERDYTHYNYRASQEVMDTDALTSIGLDSAEQIQKELAWAIRYIQERQYEC